MTCWKAANKVGLPPGVVYYHFHPGAKESVIRSKAKWRKEHPEEARRQSRETARREYARIPGIRRMRAREWYHAHSEECRKKAAEWRKAHPEKVKEYAKQASLRKKLKRRRMKALMDGMRAIVVPKLSTPK